MISWPASKLRMWLTYLKVKQELEAQAMGQGPRNDPPPTTHAEIQRMKQVQKSLFQNHKPKL